MRPKSLADPFPLRLDPTQKTLLDAEAKRLGVSLQELIRQRLDITQAVQAPIATLREELIYALGRGIRGGADPAPRTGVVDDALLVELILGMRQLLGPARLRSIQNEIVEMGLAPWTGGDAR